MKSIYAFLGCICWNLILAQSTTKIEATDNNLVLGDIAGIHIFGNLGATPGSKIIGINALNTERSQQEIFLCPFSTVSDIRSAFMIYHKEGSLFINKMLQSSIDDVAFIGTYNQAGASHLMIFGTFNKKVKMLTSLKVITSIADPGMLIKPVDFLYHNFTYYILAETVVNYFNEFNSKIVLFKTDGRSVLWSAIYNSIAPIHSEIPQSISLTPNLNICIGGLIARSTDRTPRMMLAQVDLDGNPIMLKTVELKSADQRTNHKFSWTFVGYKGTNIHLFSQAIDEQSEPGTVLVTMFDNDLNLRTWRNYNADIRVESANLDGSFFMFSGQAPVEKKSNGFMMMKVNASNAIVEQFKFFDTEITYDSPISSSAIAYERARDNTWTIVKPNQTGSNHLVLINATSNLDHRCAQDFSTNVAMDPMTLTEMPFAAKSNPLQMSNLDGHVREVSLSVSEVCYVTKDQNISRNQIALLPNPSNGQFIIKSDKIIESYQLVSAQGLVIEIGQVLNNQVNIRSDISAGMYFIKLHFGDKKSTIQKLVLGR
jgi:hypothetical protein